MLQRRLGEFAVTHGMNYQVNTRKGNLFRMSLAVLLILLSGGTRTDAQTSPAAKTPPKAGSLKDGPPKAAATPQTQAADDGSEEIAKQKLIIDRFVTVLERNPRRGTAFDKIYGFHIENGTVEALAQQFRDRAAKSESDYPAWMILGLIESQRGRDAAAVEAFAKAKVAKKEDPISSYYHGQALVLIGRGDDAVPSFEEAIARKPSQTDLFEIIQALGRVHQRAQRSEQALAVWNQFEKSFPGDARVQEQIAVTLVEEGQFAEALPRYESLVKSAKDEYRKSTFQMEAAELKVRLKKSAEGIADLESLQSKLNPDSWLFREVRRKIENVFLRTEDQEGLVNYYITWVGKHAEDVDAMARLSRLLARQARVPEAREWLDKALKIAPSRKELRLAFIQQLVEDHRFGDAIEQYKALDQADPNNPDYLREWGRLVMRDGGKPLEARRKDAAEIWKKLLTTRGNDPLVTVQVADLLRNAGLTEEALPLYEKAVTLAPTAPQYREFLGEYLHLLKRPEEALATWKKIAEGKQKTPENLSRLAEVLSQFGYAREASAEILAAAELDARDFSLQLRAADYQARAEQLDGAIASLGRAEGLSQNDEEREAVLAQRMRILQQMGKLTEEAETLRTELEKDGSSADKWYRLARYQESLRLLPEATKSIARSLEIAPTHIPILSAAARIDEQSGAVASAVERFRKLAIVDRRSKSDYLTQIARLEVQMGRTDEALTAGRDLIAASPGNIEAYQFFADLCFRLNRREEGLTALRRSVRANPTDPTALLPLAAALAADFRTDEAIEIYWQAFDKSGSLDDKLTVVNKLTDLYLQQGQFDRLVERLDRNRKEEDARREMTICLAQAHQTAGDIGLARQELQTLLSDDSRDTTLLQQVSKLAEADRDLPAAIRFQELLVKAAPAPETEMRLAQLYSTAGDTREASAIFVRLAQREEDEERLLRIVDGLLATDKNEEVLAILEPKLRENARNWELLYREGIALFPTRKAEAATRFRAILALNAPDDEIGAYEKGRQARAARQGGPPSALTPANTASAQRLNPVYRTSYIYEIRQGIGLDGDVNQTGTMRSVWAPSAFFQARAAAVGWLSRIAAAPGEQDALQKELHDRSDAPNSSPRDNWDWIYYTTVILQTGDQDRDAATKLAKRGDLSGQFALLRDIQTRPENQQLASGRTAATTTSVGTPLPEEELNLAVQSLNALVVAADDPKHSLSSMLPSLALLVSTELKRAKRDDEAKKLFDQIIARDKTPQQIATSISLIASNGSIPEAVAAFDRFAKLDISINDNKSPTSTSNRLTAATALCQVMGAAGTPIEQVRNIFNQYADYHIRRNELRRQDRVASRTVPSSGRSYYTTYVAGQPRNAQVAFPPAGQFWDQTALNVLRNAYEVYAAADLASDFTAEIEKRRTAASGAEPIYWELARAYIEFWNGEKEAAATYFAKATELAKQDLQLQFDLANLHVQAQNIEEALAILDKIQPSDQRLVIQKETAILQFAQQLGDLDRAMLSAKRLFGMRIDSSAQMTLADAMRRLGMNEEAESVLKRAERQTASRSTALSALMTQYLVEGKNELAAEAAYRILRSTRATIANPRTGMTQDDVNRQTALRCLQQTGKLKDQITLLEAQLERSPQSEQLYTALGEYYTAAGDTKKSEALQGKLLALRPDDADLRYRIGMTYSQLGKGKEACDLLLEALRKKPSLFGNQYYEVIQIFRSNRRMADLGKLFTEIDLRQMGRYYVAQNIIQYLMDDNSTTDLAIVVLKRAVEAYPEYGANYFLQSYNTQAIRNPEIAAMFRKALVPAPDKAKRMPWSQGSSSYSNDGNVYSTEVTLIDGSTPEELKTLKAEVEKTLSAAPQWQEGHALLAMVSVRNNDLEEARKQFKILEGFEYVDYYAMFGAWKVAQEFRKLPELRAEAMKLYEIADKSWRTQQRGASGGPGTALANMLVDQGDKETGRKLILASLAEPTGPQPSNPGYAEYNRTSRLYMAGQKLEQLGFNSDALKVYRDLVNYGKQNDAIIRNYSSDNSYTQSGEALLTQLVRRLMDQSDRTWVKELLQSQETKANASPIDLFIVNSSPATSGSRRTVYDENGNPIRTSTSPRLTSFLANVLKEKSTDASLDTELTAQLTDLAAKHPNDLQVAIAESIFALAKLPAEGQKTALSRLEKLIDAAPLEELPAGKRANARQRAAAAPQTAIWLVARDCLEKPEWISLGNKFADRALAAAQRQANDSMTQGLTFELAAAAAKRGDLPAAEAAYRRLIESSVTPKLVKTVVAPTAPGAAPPTATPPQATPPGNAPRRAPVTTSQFLLAAGIAESAAKLGLKDVSLFTIREAFSAGMPVADAPGGGDPFGAASGRAISRLTAAGGMPGGGVEIERPLQQVLSVWSRAKMPPAEVSQILEGIMMPATRPREILTFNALPNPNNPEGDGLTKETGLLGALADWATRAHREAEIESQVAQRKGTVDSAISGDALLLYIALAKNDAPKITAGIKALGERVKSATTATAQATLSAAFTKVFERPELRDEAVPVLTTLMQASFTKPSRSYNYGAPPLLNDLVEHGIRQGKLQDAKTLVDAYLKSRVAIYAAFGSADSYNEFQYADFTWSAYVVSRGSDLPSTLEALARVADAPAPRRSSNYNQIAIAVRNLAQQLQKLPATERYAMLRDWALPTAQRRSFRILSTPEISQPVPTELASKFGYQYQMQPSKQIVGTAQLLIDAAVEAGKLDELAAQLKPLLEEKIPQSTTLALLVAVAQKDPVAAKQLLTQIDARLEEYTQKVKASEKDQRGRTTLSVPSDYSELGAILACAKMDENRASAISILEKFGSGGTSYLANFGLDTEFLSDATRRSGEFRDLPAEARVAPPLRFWRLSGAGSGGLGDRASSNLIALNNGLLVTPAYGARAIQFRYPITGDWTFTVEGKNCNFGYGGLTSSISSDQRGYGSTDPMLSSRRIMLGNAMFPLPAKRFAESVDPESANQYEIRSKAGKLEFGVNGQFLSETVLKDASASLASPWLSISLQGGVTPPMIRNPRLTGQPTILSEVDLAASDRSDGWVTRFGLPTRGFSDSASRLAISLQPADQAATATAERYDDTWNFEKGEITGPRNETLPAASQLGITYSRTLASGEKISYEFFYEPGKSIAHPALGNLDLLIKPEGIHLGWESSRSGSQFRGGTQQLVTASELVGHFVKAEGAAPLNLKAGDWNQAELSIKANELTLKINGQVALVRQLEPTIVREFSLFHFPRESEFRVRNLKLTGDWPTSIAAEDLTKLLDWEAAPPTRDQVRVALALAAETGEVEAAKELLAAAPSLAPAQRYDALRSFVLPSETNPSFRDRFSFSASPTPGQEIHSPAVALIAAAKESGKLADLKTELFTISKDAGPNAPHADALLAMIAVDSGDEALASEKLKSLVTTVRTSSASSRSANFRAAWLAAHAASRLGGARPDAAALASAMGEEIRKPNVQVDDDLRIQVNVLQKLIPTAALATALLPSSKLSTKAPAWRAYDAQFASHAVHRPLSLASYWSAENGLIELFAMGKPTQAIYRTPLTGDFVVTCKSRRSKSCILLPTYGGIAVFPGEENSIMKLAANGQSSIVIPMENVGPITDWFDYKIEVAAEVVTISINGKRVLREKLNSQSDPFIRLREAGGSASGSSSGGEDGLPGAIRDFAISGSPKIPTAVTLSKGAALTGWEALFYSESDFQTASTAARQRAQSYGEAAVQPTGWRYERDEITAVGSPEHKDCVAESLLRYQRPLEVGDEISLEFFYDAGKTELSPAIGRTALLLRPEGLKTHQLTNLPLSSEGPAIDNETAVTGAKPITLKSGQWNELKLTIRADQIQLSVNGETIGAVPKEHSEAEMFGFFRRKNQIGAKVKNVTVKGAWPSELPK